ncbi:MAG: acetyl-CoA acetyltransferase, partial [Bauldia litoralis]
MNANAFIDQSAAVILTSAAKARALGVPQDRWVYLHGTADAYDHWHISDRIDFHSSPAMRIVAEETFEMAGVALDDLDFLDLYSCFPSAVEIACQEMGIREDDPRGLTVTGGFPYFGGPGNNYVTHSIAEMTAKLRSRPGSMGMVTANGNYVTKQSAGIYSTRPREKPFAPRDPKTYQARIDDAKGPATTETPAGAAQVETYAVMHDRKGPSFAILFGRQADGKRFIANAPEDPGLLLDMCRRDYLGAAGRVATDDDGHAVFVPD